VTSLKATLTAIEGGVEPALPIVAAGPEPTPAPPSLVAPSRPAIVDPLRVELATFFAANDDVLSYFGPEAAEHLEAMTAAILALERGGGAGVRRADARRVSETRLDPLQRDEERAAGSGGERRAPVFQADIFKR